MGQIFISYAREDQDLARPLAEALAALGWLVWWDPQIRAGAGFRATIAKALQEAGCVIVLWSKDSIESEWVCAEAAEGMERRVLLSLLLDKVKLPLPFGERQAVDFSGWSGSISEPRFASLVDRIESLAGPPSVQEGDDEGWEYEEPQEPPEKRKLVVLYAHEDRAFLKQSTKTGDFLKFSIAVAREQELELWWDEHMQHPGFDDVIEELLEEAAVVLLVVSVSFLLSGYSDNPRAWRAYRRLQDRGTVFFTLLYQPVPAHRYDWLKAMQTVPGDGRPLYGRKKLPIYKELTERIQIELAGRRKPLRDDKSLRTLRLLDAQTLSKLQLDLMQKAACREAERFVPDPATRKAICTEATRLKSASDGRPLSKRQLAALDEKILARKEKREPDPKKIRWVLRCNGLHPQARVRGLVAAA